MPNWCYNSLRVSGPAGEVKKFREAVTKDEGEHGPRFTMEGLWPTPPELLNESSPAMYRGDAEDVEAKAEWQRHHDSLIEQYGAADWYEWRISNWGTKWDAADSEFSSDEDHPEQHLGYPVLNISYSTAWSPNSGFIRWVSEVFPELHFRLLYEEAGMGFCGVLVCEAGEVLADMEEDLQWMDPDMGCIVEWDSDLNRWKVTDTGEVIDDEEFYPVEYNPFSELY